MRKLRESKLVSVAASSLVAVLGVAFIAYAGTTISTNVNTGGTLTVTGVSTQTGNVFAGAGVYATGTIQATGDILGYGTLNVGTTSPVTGRNSLTGNLLASGNISGANLTATGTLTVSGATTLGYASTSGITLGTTHSLYVGGVSTTTGTTGDVSSNRYFVASSTSATTNGFGVATATPVAEFAATGSGTTTVYLTSTSATKGSCIEMLAPAGATYAVYVNNAGTLTATAGSCK